MIKDTISILNRVFTSKLFYITFYTTARCNSRCSHCFYWKEIGKSNKKEELNFTEIEKISKKLGDIYYLTLTGGEPTLREDITDIIKLFYKQNNVKQLVLLSNGLNPKRLYEITEDVVKNCPNMIFTVGLSIDDFEKNHDKIRGVNGSFKKVIESITLLKKLERFSNFDISVNTTFMKCNKENLIELNKFIFSNLKIPHSISYIRGDVKDSTLKETDFQIYKRLSKIIDRQGLKRNCSIFSFIKQNLIRISRDIIIEVVERKKYMLPCQALKRSVVISEKGDIFPCELLNTNLGNLRDYEYDLNKIINTEKAKKLKKWIRKTKCKCTWECIIPLNIAFSLKGNIMLIKKIISSVLR